MASTRKEKNTQLIEEAVWSKFRAKCARLVTCRRCFFIWLFEWFDIYPMRYAYSSMFFPFIFATTTTTIHHSYTTREIAKKKYRHTKSTVSKIKHSTLSRTYTSMGINRFEIARTHRVHHQIVDSLLILYFSMKICKLCWFSSKL